MIVVNLSDLGARGVAIHGYGAFAGFGSNVSSAGDVNGDGIDDIVVGAASADGTNDEFGASYVLFGKVDGFGQINLMNFSSHDGFIIKGAAAGDIAGEHIAAAGDVNGDGFDDVIIGVPRNDDGGYYAGKAYVIFGKPNGFGPIDLAHLAAKDGFVISGSVAYQEVGMAVAAAGDVNNDGYDDLLFGSNTSSSFVQIDGGRSYAVFGSQHPSSLSTTDITSETGVFIYGLPGDGSGRTLSSVGDFNGDGLTDFVMSAPVTADKNGRVYVVYGKAGGFPASIDLTHLSASDGLVISGGVYFDTNDNLYRDDYAGIIVSSAGDVNGDGFDDIIFSAHDHNYVIFGAADRSTPLRLDRLDVNDGFSIGFSGSSLTAAGDVNGDGFDDVAIGMPGTTYQASGRVGIIFGKADGFRAINIDNLTDTDGFVINGILNDDIGYSVSSADINDDGFSDIVIGSGFNSAAGESAGVAYTVFGVVPTEPVHLTGTVAGQNLSGGVGNDILDGAAGDDVLRGNDGQDQLIGGIGNDHLRGDAGDDTLSGNAGNDLLDGGAGNDRLDGSTGNDIMVGGTGNDVLIGGIGIDTASYAAAETGVVVRLGVLAAQQTGGAGADTLSGIENVTGSAFADNLSGDAGNNTLNGGEGNDILLGAAGNDLLNGFNGNDTASYLGAASGVTVDLTIASAQDTHGAGTDRLALIENLRGSAFCDVLTGNAVPNVINGAEGDDRIAGNAGNDTLVGGAGNDRVFGGAGQDKVDGGDGNDVLTGNAGNDNIFGGNGDDVMGGGGGRDSLTGGAGADRFVYAALTDSPASAADKILDFSHAAGDRIDLSAIDAITGGSNDAFTAIVATFDGHAGELRIASLGATTLVQADVDGDGHADFALLVTTATALTAADFIL